jgi:hypothetical protein
MRVSVWEHLRRTLAKWLVLCGGKRTVVAKKEICSYSRVSLDSSC